MFSGFMVDAWVVGTIIAVMAGVVGFFVVLRGAAFVAHGVPMSAFAGAAGAGLIGVSTLAGLGLFSLGGALTIGWLGRRGRHDVATALAVVVLLGTGSLFVSWNSGYASEVYSLLFGEVLGVSANEVALTGLLALLVVAAAGLIYRPLLLTSVVPEVAAARGTSGYRVDMAFLAVVALATTLSVPVVGVLLLFSLMVGPSAAAGCFTNRPPLAIGLGVALALATVWAAIAASYVTNWPVGFYVGVTGAACYVAGHLFVALRGRRRAAVARRVAPVP